MRDLDSSNPAICKPSRFASAAAVLPFLLALFCLPLASAVAPTVPPCENPITVMLCAILTASFLMMLLPFVLKWDWRAKYFGVLPLYVGSVGLLCFVPCLCIAFYGTTDPATKTLPLILCVALHYVWCRRNISFYRIAMHDVMSRRLIYREESDAVYYLQRGDLHLVEKESGLKQVPPVGYFIFSVSAAFLLLFARGAISAFFGVPFFHIFLLVCNLPTSVMCVGLAVRGGLIFYVYPGRIERATGKRVYVDMCSKP